MIVSVIVQQDRIDRSAYLSKEPGVKAGESPTLKLLDLFAFFSKYFFARMASLELYSFSIAERSR